MTGKPSAAHADALAAGLRALGVRAGQDLLVHCSMGKIGPVHGGPATLLSALQAVAGQHATIVVPTHTAGNSRSSAAFRAATAGMSTAEYSGYVTTMVGFDPKLTPSEGMGRLAEHVRKHSDARRSSHPQTSFAALGPRATECTTGHVLDCHLGEASPLGWLYRQDAAVLLLGVDYTACTAFHLAEYRLPTPRRKSYRCFVMEDGKRQEYKFEAVACMDDDFMELGARLDDEPFVRRRVVGAADCRLLPVRDAVDFAVAWPPFQRNRAAA